jgi:hypothetical protein
MHLKGEKLIMAMVWFALFLVSVFFINVIGIDVPNFQFGPESYITSQPVEHAASTAHAAH